MLGKRIPTILPPMPFEKAIETTRIHNVAGTLEGSQGLMGTRPFRPPHHSCNFWVSRSVREKYSLRASC
jgi:magnesium chelatase family protein